MDDHFSLSARGLRKRGAPRSAACPFVARLGLQGATRFAQTFITLRGGKLTRAEVELRLNPEDATVILDIRDVNGAEEPDTALASAVVANIPATALSDPPRRISAEFSALATVVVGLRFAISATIQETVGGFGVNTNGNSDTCPDGDLFVDASADGDFQLASGDMVFATFVTA